MAPGRLRAAPQHNHSCYPLPSSQLDHPRERPLEELGQVTKWVQLTRRVKMPRNLVHIVAQRVELTRKDNSLRVPTPLKDRGGRTAKQKLARVSAEP